MSDNNEAHSAGLYGVNISVEAKATRDNFAEWEATLPMTESVSAHAEDAAGNIEKLAHVRRVKE